MQIRRGERPIYDQVLVAFQRKLAGALTGHPASNEPDGMSFDMPSVEVEKTYHLRTFVERSMLADSLTAWLEGHECGYVFYEGAAGTGKSAYASFLMNRNKWPGHLVKRENQRDKPERFLQFLISQLMERRGTRCPLPSEAGALGETLAKLLLDISAHRLRSGLEAETIVVTVQPVKLAQLRNGQFARLWAWQSLNAKDVASWVGAWLNWKRWCANSKLGWG